MKVAVVCPYDLDRPGGVQVQAGGLVDGLRAAGVEAWLVGPGTREGPPGTRHLGPTVTVPINGSRAPVKLGAGVAATVAAAIAGADLVHVHEPFVPAVGPAAARAELPVVATFHADAPAWVARLYRARRRAFGRFAAVTAVSPVAAAALPPSIPVEIIPNGIALTGTGGERGAGPVVFLGRDEPRKGLDVVLEAWPRIRAAHPGSELVVAGAERDERPAGVRYLGRIDDAEKQALLASAAVFVAPNLGGESFGIVVAEAMAAGAPLVASAIPAFVAVTGGAARLVAPGDAVGLALAVAALLDDPAARREASRAGVARAAAFAWDRVVDAYRAVYAATGA